MHAWEWDGRRGLEEWCQQFPFEGRLHRPLNEKPKYIQESTVRRGNFFWGPAGFFSNSESLLRLSSKAACFQQSYFYPVCLPAFASAGICDLCKEAILKRQDATASTTTYYYCTTQRKET